MREVIVINPNAKPLHDKIRTAAYCRVSSDSDEQLASFSSQVSEYTNRITKNPDWVMVDIYADEGISGTSAAKRPEFQRLMADCRKKKIDRILTKSISRFARNVKECIAYIRELQSLDVSIEFEKEGIDTAFLSGEMMVAVFGSLAQEESASISSNMRLSYKGRMERGEFITNFAPYGYRWNSKSLEIIEEEASIVRRIFDYYINGNSQSNIANLLNKECESGNKVWQERTVGYILHNEKYIGDALLQKQVTIDAYSHVSKNNHGEATQYYIRNSHPAIVSRNIYQKAQTLVNMRLNHVKGYNRINALRKNIICAECGAVFKQRKNKNGTYSWICYKHDGNRLKCPTPPVNETVIIEAFTKLAIMLGEYRDTILLPMHAQLKCLQSVMLTHEHSLSALSHEITFITDQLHMLSRLRSRDLIDDESYISQTNEMNRKLLALREQRQIAIQEQQEDDALEKTQKIIDILQDAPENLASLEDGGVFESIVDKVIIDKGKNITFRLINGLELGGFHG